MKVDVQVVRDLGATLREDLSAIENDMIFSSVKANRTHHETGDFEAAS